MVYFINGFNSWQETHFEIVSTITYVLIKEPLSMAKLDDILIKYDVSNLYDLAKNLTDDFELLNRGRRWDGEFLEEVEKFTRTKLNINE